MPCTSTASPCTRQEQGQQGGQHRQLARPVVAGQHHGGLVRVGHQLQALARGIQKTGHLLRCFTLDSHGQAKGAHFQVSHRAVEDLAHQIGGLIAVQRACAVASAPDFLDVACDTHAVIVRDGCKQRAMSLCPSRYGLAHRAVVILARQTVFENPGAPILRAGVARPPGHRVAAMPR